MKTSVGIFEQNRTDQFLYKKWMENINRDLEPLFFENVNDGIAAAQKGTFDIVVIDIHFNGNHTGFDILQKLRIASPKEFVAIGVTALLQEGDLERVLAAGFAICLEKPLHTTPGDLLKTT